jgi:hypothetical protein
VSSTSGTAPRAGARRRTAAADPAAEAPAGELPVVQAAQLATREAARSWLVRELWSQGAVGFIGGAPKACKSWLGLDLAVSVATGTPCLGRYAVDDPGPALVYLAEDALPLVRERLASICLHRGLALESLDVHVITSPSIRLDVAADRDKLSATLARRKPRLLVLDPLVRLHALDENSAAEISELLGFLRVLSREHSTALVVVHHMSKKGRAQLGQALRGSGDLHAWADSSLYLTHRNGGLLLTVEHRSAAAAEPVTLELLSRSDGSATHLEPAAARTITPAQPVSLPSAVKAALTASEAPVSRVALRRQLRVNNQQLGHALTELERTGDVRRTPAGWTVPKSSGSVARAAASAPTPSPSPARPSAAEQLGLL